MIGEAIQALSLLSVLVKKGEIIKSVAGKIPIYLHPSLYEYSN